MSLFGNEEDELYKLRQVLAHEFDSRRRERAQRRVAHEQLPPEAICQPVNEPPATCRRCGCAIVRGDHESQRWMEPVGGTSPPARTARVRYHDRHASAEVCLVALEVRRQVANGMLSRSIPERTES